MLPKADDNRQVNISRKRIHKRKKKMKEEREKSTTKKRSREYEKYLARKHKFTPPSTRGLVTFKEQEYIA
jgi:hypothetical protein